MFFGENVFFPAASLSSCCASYLHMCGNRAAVLASPPADRIRPAVKRHCALICFLTLHVRSMFAFCLQDAKKMLFVAVNYRLLPFTMCVCGCACACPCLASKDVCQMDQNH